MQKFINKLLARIDLRLVRNSSFNELIDKQRKFYDYELCSLINKEFLPEYFEYLEHSKSQLRQDLFVLSELRFKEGGFFVEFGATDGVNLSNSHLMETKFGWNGILAEPAKVWHQELLSSRKASIETDCVWKSTGDKLLFNEVNDKTHNGELSTIEDFSYNDNHGDVRKKGNRYEVNTISLIDLLHKYDAPKYIDYLSIDTEGSEFDILSAFDFDLFDIKIITCEHNYTPMREKIFDLLTKNGYERKLSEVSMFDDWYVRR